MKTMTIEMQDTETGPWIANNDIRQCFACKQPILKGQAIYRVKNSTYLQCRHICCARTKVKKKEYKEERQQIGRAANGRVVRSAKGL